MPSHTSQHDNYCILGTGFAGTAALVHFIDKLEAQGTSTNSINLYTVESRMRNGSGFPYCPQELLPCHLCNNQARAMSLKDNDFVDWLWENKEHLAENHPELIKTTHPLAQLPEWQPDDDAFYPRALFGVYLEDRFEHYIEKARALGINVQLFNGYQAVNAERNGDGISFSLELKHLQSNQSVLLDDLNKILLATGHWTPQNRLEMSQVSNYMAGPYPYKKLRQNLTQWLSEKDKITVLVKGMGPSAVDAILSLVNTGEFIFDEQGHITAFKPDSTCEKLQVVVGSRSGFFPASRGQSLEVEFKYLVADTITELEDSLGYKLSLQGILELVDKELRHATENRFGLDDILAPKYGSCHEKLLYDSRQPKDNDVIHAVILKARRMKFYRYLNSEEKALYDKTLDSHFIRTAVPIPQLNVEKLNALFASGVLKSVAMSELAEVNPQPADNGFTLSYTEAGKAREMHVDTQIDASGQSFNLKLHPSELVAHLLAQKELVAHKEDSYIPGGIMLQSNETYAVMRQDEQGQIIASENLYSFGSLTRFWQNERNFAAAFTEAANWLGNNWCEFHQQHVQAEQNTADITPTASSNTASAVESQINELAG